MDIPYIRVWVLHAGEPNGRLIGSWGTSVTLRGEIRAYLADGNHRSAVSCSACCGGV